MACLESFKLDMINLACGVIRISNKYSCLEIFDQKGNPNFLLPWGDSISFGIRALGSRSDICFICVSFQFGFYLFIYIFFSL